MGVVAQEADNPEKQSADDQGSAFDLGSVSGPCGASLDFQVHGIPSAPHFIVFKQPKP
jgi:hypothetical protein